MAGSSRLSGQVGDYLLAVAWSRVLSDVEVLEFSRNPWQIFGLRVGRRLTQNGAAAAAWYHFSMIGQSRVGG